MMMHGMGGGGWGRGRMTRAGDEDEASAGRLYDQQVVVRLFAQEFLEFVVAVLQQPDRLDHLPGDRQRLPLLLKLVRPEFHVFPPSSPTRLCAGHPLSGCSGQAAHFKAPPLLDRLVPLKAIDMPNTESHLCIY